MKVTACLYCGNKGLEAVTRRSDNNGILRCERCGVMMVENLSDDYEQLYTADYFEKNEATKNGYTNYLSSPVANMVGKYGFTRLFAREAGRHLDLGCADGSLMEIFASEGFQSSGLEISKDAVSIAQAKGLRVSFSKLDAFPKNLPKSNVITAFDLLEHADKPGVVLRESYDNLEEGGYFVFSTLSVKHNDPSDYWFNNSLEHYIYYNRENLNYVLTDVFGAGNFAFVEEEVNGVAEFWGFAKKGKAGAEKKLVDLVATESYDPKDPDSGFLLSLFYNQASKFAKSEAIIDHFKDKWPVGRRIEAEFYNNFFQGKLARAIEVTNEQRYMVPAGRSVFWQALANTEEEFAKIRQQDIVGEYNSEVVGLREDLFKVRDELQSLINSRVLGKVIKARSVVGDSSRKALPAAKHAARAGVHKTRRTVAKVLPPPLSRAIMRVARSARQQVRDAQGKQVQYVQVANERWPIAKPLLSVVIPYYNRADTVDETLESLAKQTFRSFEIILVDDGSTDQASIDKLAIVQKAYPGMHVIRQKNAGVAAARNKGIGQSKGKYIICLDSDDVLDPTYVEKALLVLETSPDVSLITTHQDMFGVINEVYTKSPYDPLHLYDDNMVITAAAFKKEAWEKSGGYKSDIGYEDWEFWLSMAELGYWGKLIPEPLFYYRTSLQSRYVEDKDVHWNNIRSIRDLHPKYKSKVRALVQQRAYQRSLVTPDTALLNLHDDASYALVDNGKPNVLITTAWMTFGGVETLLYNFCREIKPDFNISFITGLESDNPWEYKFREITPNIYHMANLLQEPALYLEFVSNYIRTRKIDVLHIVHNGFIFEMLPELKRRHPHLKVAVTVFNDRAVYFEQSLGFEDCVDAYTSDNQSIGVKYQKLLQQRTRVEVYPNGIDCFNEFNPTMFDRRQEREALGLQEGDTAVFFVGRLSEEKNPDVFVNVAKKIKAGKQHASIKFFMVGDGPMNTEILQMIKDVGSSSVTYLGYQPSAEVARYMSAADVFVLPSKVEGFPLSILEAMAMRLVVIASDVGAISDVIESGKAGYVVTPGSADEISDVIIALSSDGPKMDAIKQHARREVEQKYSLQVFGGSYRDLYNTLKKGAR